MWIESYLYSTEVSQNSSEKRFRWKLNEIDGSSFECKRRDDGGRNGKVFEMEMVRIEGDMIVFGEGYDSPSENTN